MKNKIIALAVFAACAGPAFAQGNVTLYGLVDEGIDYTNNVGGSHVYELQSGYAQGSRWGMKGADDLGGGLKAVFQLENGFDVNNGKLGEGGLMFGRQAYVGLTDSTFGAVTFGRQYDSLVDYLAQTTANGNWGGYLFSHPYDNDNTDNSFRVNNTVKYASPNLAGFQAGATYSFSNDAKFANNRQYSVGAQYANGPLLVAMAYLQANNPSSSAGGAINNGGDENFVADRLRVFGGGINYTAGPVTAGLVYTNSNLTSPLSTTYISGSILPGAGTLNALRFQNFEVNGKYQITPALFIGAQYVYTLERFDASSGTSKPRIHSVGMMADYNVSKRTDLYAQAAYQKITGDTTGTALDQAYVPGAADASSTRDQLVLRLAIRHKF